MSKTHKILTGLLAFMPLFLFIGYVVMFFSFIFEMITQPDQMQEPEQFLGRFVVVFAFLGVMILLSFVKLIYFIIHITNNPKLDSNERIVWIVIGIFVGMFGFPIYWYLKIWKEE